MSDALPNRPLLLLLVLAAGCGGKTPQELCGAGTADHDGVCVALDAGAQLSCGPGTVLVAGACVAIDAGPGDSCGPGTELDGGQCVPVDAGPGVACGPGTELDGGACVPVDAGPGVVCGSGTEQVGGQCVPVDAGPGIVCGPGTVQDGGECVADAGPTSCGPGSELDGGVCVALTCDTTSCNTTHFSGGCRASALSSSPVCNCSAPYYDANCDSAAIALSTATAFGTLPANGIVYYSFILPAGASSTFLNVFEENTAGQLDVYVSQNWLPFFAPPGQPDYSYSDFGSTAKHLMVLPLPDPPTAPEYILLRNTGAADPFRYNITVIPY